MWTFETYVPAAPSAGWQTSSERFDTIEPATRAAASWMAISADNAIMVWVRLKRID